MQPWRWRHRRGTLHGITGRPAIMAVINLTPDSFSDGGRFGSVGAAVGQACEAAEHGAEIIDLGAESTRPGAPVVSEAEELDRLLPVLRELRGQTAALLSIDTTKAAVAAAAAAEGADIINDISGGRFDPKMLTVVRDTGLGFVAMHTTGRPAEMQQRAHYESVTREVAQALCDRLQEAIDAGIPSDAVLLDPGFGFGKLLHHNIDLFGALPELCRLPRPLLVGVSRKSMLRAIAGAEPEALEHATTTAHLLAALAGAAVLRTHHFAAAVAMRRTLLHLRPQAE
ncbi:MAG: dihydropteroate synthase [Deltaproteobacteria bacterium]|nr:dihydropteroate synthase [Deltaproteobacteria bacterium]